jgi:hypothetical protein
LSIGALVTLTIKPHHISILLGTYYPNDEDVSFLEQMATNKGRFREEADKTSMRVEELLLNHEDDELVLTIVLVENLHIH